MRWRNRLAGRGRAHCSALTAWMVVFGYGAGVKGLSAASRRDDMVFIPCRPALYCGVKEDRAWRGVGAILRWAKFLAVSLPQAPHVAPNLQTFSSAGRSGARFLMRA